MYIYTLRLAADVGTNIQDRRYSSYQACAADVYKHSGVSGFYRGFVVSLLGVVLFKAFFMGGKRVRRRDVYMRVYIGVYKCMYTVTCYLYTTLLL